MPRELIVDSFAGGGGASHGITLALGRGPDVAINHDAAAIAMHAANHPRTRHLTEDVWKVDPRSVTCGRAVGLLWASPDCRHFSRAKGGKPVSKKIRSLAWVVVRWAMLAKPRVIILENVREFQDWGPLLPLWSCRACQWRGTEGQTKLARTRRRCPSCNSLRICVTEEQIPDPDRKGLTFKRFVGRLKNLGYDVGWKNLNAADYGAPTHRRRLFLVARRDGEPIQWPEPTHAAPDKLDEQPLFGRLHPYRTAAEIIDWSLPCRSIFDRTKPLADKTLRRIALGLKRYVLDNPNPFIVCCNHGGAEFRGQRIDQPMCTVTGSRDAHGLIVPELAPFLAATGGSEYAAKPRPVDQPLNVVKTDNHQAVVAPYLARICQGGGNGKYVNGAEEPLTTVVSKAEHLVVAPILSTYYGVNKPSNEHRGQPIDEPLRTQTTENRHALVAATITKFYGGVIGHNPDRPIGTVTACDHHGLVAAQIVKFRGDSTGSPVDGPLPTITSGAGAARPAGAAHALGIAAAYLARFNHGDKQWNSVDEPLGTATSQGNKFGLVYAFLVKYFGTAVGAGLDEPLHTVTGKHRFGVVAVEVAPGQHEPAVAIDVPGIGPCVIADIGLRMLTPRELASAQGFPDDYRLTGSNAAQVAKIGNSVPPVLAQRMVEANYAACGLQTV